MLTGILASASADEAAATFDAVSFWRRWYEDAGERLDTAYSDAETFVRERPAVALGLAAGSGFLLAMFLSRR